MLSMKRRTSLCSSSRKYSAIVRADRATRRRAPGGSFIWPYTRATLDSSGFSRLITPDSIISLYKSFPSRVRSPTPAKTERPLRACNVLMSSMMSTVLPTPAPPKAPIFAAFQERADEVDYFDARFQHFRAGGLLVQRRSAAVNAFHARAGESAAFVHGFTQHIEDGGQERTAPP